MATLDDFAPRTERRKADRAELARRVVDLAGEYQLAAWHSPEEPGSRQTDVDVKGPHGLKVTVRFDGYSPQREPDTYVLSWHGVDAGVRLNPGKFGNVNYAHGHKATDIVHGSGQLLALLRRRFASIRDDSAFVTGES
jgi:hypothetical protein